MDTATSSIADQLASALLGDTPAEKALAAYASTLSPEKAAKVLRKMELAGVKAPPSIHLPGDFAIDEYGSVVRVLLVEDGIATTVRPGGFRTKAPLAQLQPIPPGATFSLWVHCPETGKDFFQEQSCGGAETLWTSAEVMHTRGRDAFLRAHVHGN